MIELIQIARHVPVHIFSMDFTVNPSVKLDTIKIQRTEPADCVRPVFAKTVPKIPHNNVIFV